MTKTNPQGTPLISHSDVTAIAILTQSTKKDVVQELKREGYKVKR